MKKVYLSGGCFWGLEELFRTQPGIVDTEVGYTGGSAVNPSYENHIGHAETVELTYHENVTTLNNILGYFFKVHDPTTLNKQGNDLGDSYRSAYFYQSEGEKRQVQSFINIVEESKKWPGPIVTTLEPLVKFHPAEDYHQDYLRKNPNGYTCHFERNIEFN